VPRACAIVTFGFVVVYATLHVVFGLAVRSEAMWGFDILAYGRWWHAAVFAVVVVGSLSLAHRRVMAAAEGMVARLASAGGRLSLPLTYLALFAASVAVLWLLKTKYSGGDSHWMSQTMPVFLKRAPLSSAVLVVGTGLGMALGFRYVASMQAAILVMGAASVCGLFGLFRLLLGGGRRAGLFVAASVACYGISRLLPGYIEIYGVYLLFLIGFHWVLVRYGQTERGLVVLLAALLVLVLAHVQALVVVPGALALTGRGCWRRGRRWRLAVGWGAFVVVLVVVYPHLRHGNQSFHLLPALARLARPGAEDGGFWGVHEGASLLAPPAVLRSAGHWLRVVNVHARVSAAGVALAAAGLALWWQERKGDLLLAVAAVNSLLFLVGTVVFYNFHHPIARDWDMFGPGAVFVLVLAALLWRRLPEAQLRRAALVVLPVVGWITLLWLAQQAGAWGLAPPPASHVGFVSPG